MPDNRSSSFFSHAERTSRAYERVKEFYAEQPIYNEAGDAVLSFDDYCTSRAKVLIGVELADYTDMIQQTGTYGDGASYHHPHFRDESEPSYKDASYVDRIVFSASRINSNMDYLLMVKMNILSMMLDDYAENGIVIDDLRAEDFDTQITTVAPFDQNAFDVLKTMTGQKAQDRIAAVQQLWDEAAENRKMVEEKREKIFDFSSIYEAPDNESFEPQ